MKTVAGRTWLHKGRIASLCAVAVVSIATLLSVLNLGWPATRYVGSVATYSAYDGESNDCPDTAMYGNVTATVAYHWFHWGVITVGGVMPRVPSAPITFGSCFNVSNSTSLSTTVEDSLSSTPVVTVRQDVVLLVLFAALAVGLGLLSRKLRKGSNWSENSDIRSDWPRRNTSSTRMGSRALPAESGDEPDHSSGQ